VGVLRAADDDSAVRAVVVTGEGDVFSTGADLTEASVITNPRATNAYFRRLRDLTDAVEHLTKPVVAGINGFCVTGGLEFAMACDMRIAEQSARFSITSARIGSLPGAGGTQRLPRLVGTAVAKDLLMSGRWVDSEEALNIGLVNQVCADGEGLNVADEWISECEKMAPLSVWLAKWAINTGSDLDLEAALDFESALATIAFATNDKKEGMDAFLAKRAAHWSGS
jgi:enoyl-CoA hydratase/carnithine racemase